MKLHLKANQGEEQFEEFINKRDQYEKTALECADGNDEIVELLGSNGAVSTSSSIGEFSSVS